MKPLPVFKEIHEKQKKRNANLPKGHWMRDDFPRTMKGKAFLNRLGEQK